jgi:hypothetical protein
MQNALESERECCICMERDVKFAFNPCGHLYCCHEDCSSSSAFQCPQCRAQVHSRNKIFSGLSVCADKLRSIEILEKPSAAAVKGDVSTRACFDAALDASLDDDICKTVLSLSRSLASLSHTQEVLKGATRRILTPALLPAPLYDEGMKDEMPSSKEVGDGADEEQWRQVQAREAWRCEELNTEIEVKREKILRVRAGEALLKSELEARTRYPFPLSGDTDAYLSKPGAKSYAHLYRLATPEPAILR